jgi:endonuclease YncB( thermonuclease family)
MLRPTSVICLVLGILASTANADQIAGRVVSVSDGDTVVMLDSALKQYRIRLQGIDAPESKQPFGQRSKQSLSNLVYGRQVVAECPKHDKYKRSVCKIIAEGKDVNLAQIEAGMAWWYRDYAKEQSASDRAVYEATETRAKEAKLGLWADAAPVPPWNWRKQLAR